MNYLISFFRSKLDLSNIGLQRGEKESGYFCTPVGSKVIGWAGVDGIHFCTVKGFGDLIFAVNPTYDPGHYVHPVARNFEDFLRLILACHDTAAIEQCWFMDREVFEEFLETNPPTEEMQTCLDAIEKKYKLTPMEDSFAYMHQLQEEFDYDALVYPPEYYEIVDVPSERQPPEWKVTWDGDFFDDNPEAVGGEPVCVDTWFHWAGIDWYVPEVYPFEQGLVMYILGKVDPEQVPMEDYSEFLSNEAWEKMQAENPLNLHARHEMTINGVSMRPAGSTGSTWVPAHDWNLESKWVLEHYGLDVNYAWQINRVNFLWLECGKIEIQKMSLTMMQYPVSISGTHFKTPAVGERVILTHPSTGAEFTLTAQEIRRETADYRNLRDDSMEYPAHYTQMVFTMEPPVSRNQFRIVDCARSDQPKPRIPSQTQTVACIGIIGGASSVGTIIRGEPERHAANSALHFQPVDEIEWRIVFQDIPNKDLTISLI